MGWHALVRAPWLGGTFAVDLDHLPPGNSALVWIGASRTSFGPLPLPLDLTMAGMTGGQLLVSPDAFAAAFNWNGSARVAVLIPPDPVLAGAWVFQQGLVLDRTANPFGAVVTNGGTGRIGGR